MVKKCTPQEIGSLSMLDRSRLKMNLIEAMCSPTQYGGDLACEVVTLVTY